MCLFCALLGNGSPFLVVIAMADFASVPTRTYVLPFVDRRRNGGDWQQRIVRAASFISRKSYFPIRSANSRISTVEKPAAFMDARASVRASREGPSFSFLSSVIDSRDLTCDSRGTRTTFV